MKCPRCGGLTRVYDTDQRPEGTVRRRQCTSSRCGEKFKSLQPPEQEARFLRGYVPIAARERT